MLEIRVERVGDYTRCRAVGDLDAYAVGQFRQAMARLVPTARLNLDLTEVRQMHSAGRVSVIGAVRRARESNREPT